MRRMQGSLSDNWSACDGGGSTAVGNAAKQGSGNTPGDLRRQPQLWEVQGAVASISKDGVQGKCVSEQERP
jgi:hypothetical protein